MSSSTLLTAQEVEVLLGLDQHSEYSEDERHPWCPRISMDSNSTLQLSTTQLQLWDRPLLRLWDYISGSKPERDSRMLARDSRRFLATRQDRIETLTLHADHKIRMKTPYISFTSSPTAIEDLAHQWDKPGRGSLCLTVIDPRLRFCKGRPVLHYVDEMRHYGIQDPYRQDYRYYEQHCLCLWEVAPEEVLGSCPWDEISVCPDWYQKIVLPEFQGFQEKWWSRRLVALKRLAAPRAITEELSAPMTSTNKLHDNTGADRVNKGESTKDDENKGETTKDDEDKRDNTKDDEDDIAEKLKNMTL